LLVFMGTSLWHIHTHLAGDLRRYAVQHPVKDMDRVDWWREGWQLLPTFRIDLVGERKQPLNIQWAGDLNGIRATLNSSGWRVPVSLNASTALRWLLPKPEVSQLPILPRLHAGRREALLRYLRDTDGRYWLLRLWPGDTLLSPGHVPLWSGTVSDLQRLQLPLLSLPRSGRSYDVALHILSAGLSNLGWRFSLRKIGAHRHTLLIGR